MENKNRLQKICDILFSITEFDIGLFDPNLNSLCFLTRRNYPDAILEFFSSFESQLLLRLGSQTTSACYWYSIPELEFIFLNIRIQVSEKDYYYAIVGPALTISYSDALVKTIFKKIKLTVSQKEDFFTLYKSLPFFQNKTKNLFLTCYHLFTTAVSTELPPVLTEDVSESIAAHTPVVSPHSTYTKADIQHNYEKEQLWRLAVSRGDLKSAKKAFYGMTSTDYLYCTPDDSLQTRKHILFSINTLCRAAAMDGGADFISVQQLHNTFFMLIKGLANSTETEILIQRILEKYCDLVIHSQNNEFSPLVKKALAYIHTNYSQPVTLHMTAESIPCGESHLSRCFHNETGKTFKAYLNEYRIKQAISLLQTGFYRITDIALLVGFSSYTKFSVAFKKITGMCASDYLNSDVPL